MTQSGILSFDEAQEVLDEAADRLPEDLFRHLNGGIVLLPDIMRSKNGPGLFTLGTYHNEPYGMGRYIVIYYGSFVQVYRHSSILRQKKALDTVLRHELTHHIESLAGVRDLEIKDEIFLEDYNSKKEK